MMCKTCDALMGNYRHLISLFKDAVRNFTGPILDDSLGAAEVERLRRECHDGDDRLMVHWRQDHPELARTRRALIKDDYPSVMLASKVLNRFSAASGEGLSIVSSMGFQRFGLMHSQEDGTVTRRHGDGTILRTQRDRPD
jgi:hypothetical protein